jgi:hypothetical protein
MSSDEIKEQIAELQSKLKAAQKAEQELESGSPVAIANLLHSTLCIHNHIDGCSWEYETWENPGSTKLDWRHKAEKLLANCKREGITVKQLVKMIGWIHGR